MKKLYLSFLLLSFAFVSQAQVAKAKTPPLNKQQTVDYISNLYHKVRPEVKNVGLENRIMIVNWTDGEQARVEIYNKSLNIIYHPNLYYYRVLDESKRVVFSNIHLESDAVRLKKALEHLIELLRVEKSTDPFDN